MYVVIQNWITSVAVAIAMINWIWFFRLRWGCGFGVRVKGDRRFDKRNAGEKICALNANYKFKHETRAIREAAPFLINFNEHV